LLGGQHGKTLDYAQVLDTLAMARKLHPGQRASLDALCKRYDIDNSQRELHGALLDAEILADVYLAMTGGQTTLSLMVAGQEPEHHEMGGDVKRLDSSRATLPIIQANKEEIAAHEAVIAEIKKASGGVCLWE